MDNDTKPFGQHVTVDSILGEYEELRHNLDLALKALEWVADRKPHATAVAREAFTIIHNRYHNDVLHCDICGDDLSPEIIGYTLIYRHRLAEHPRGFINHCGGKPEKPWQKAKHFFNEEGKGLDK